MGEEKDTLHTPFARFLKKLNYKYVCKNWNNHKRQADDGLADFIVFLPKGVVIHIEFKTPEKIATRNNGLRPKQTEWKDYLKSNDHEYYIVDNIKTAINIVMGSIHEINN